MTPDNYILKDLFYRLIHEYPIIAEFDDAVIVTIRDKMTNRPLFAVQTALTDIYILVRDNQSIVVGDIHQLVKMLQFLFQIIYL